MANQEIIHKDSQETIFNEPEDTSTLESEVVDIKEEVEVKDLKDLKNLKDLNDIKKSTKDEKDESYVTYEVTGGKLYVIILALGIVCLLASLDITVVSTALPTIVREFNDVSSYTWVITSYMLSSTSFQPMYGKVSDIFGRRPCMLVALIIFIGSSIFCGAANSMNMLIIFRGIQGIGGGGLLSLCMIIVADIVPIRKRGQYMGVLGAVFSFSTVVGPLVGGLFTDKISWRWVFYINIPLAVISFIIILLFVNIPGNDEDMKKKILRIDYAGTLFLILCVVSLLLALEWGGADYPWSSFEIIFLFCLFAFLLIIFITIEFKFAKEPIISPKIFKVRNINCMIVGCILTGFAFMSTCNYLPLYFQMVLGKKATISGLMLTPMTIIITILSISSGVLIGKYGRVNWFFIVGFILSAASGYLYSLFDINTSTIIQLLIVTFGGLGTGLTRQNMILVAQDSAPKDLLASTTAIVSFCQTIGGIVGIAIFNTILNNRVPKRLHELDPNIPVDSVDMKIINTYGTNGLKAYNDGLSFNFLTLIPCYIISLIACLCGKNIRLNRKPEKSKEDTDTDKASTSAETIEPEMKSVSDIDKQLHENSTIVDIESPTN